MLFSGNLFSNKTSSYKHNRIAQNRQNYSIRLNYPIKIDQDYSEFLNSVFLDCCTMAHAMRAVQEFTASMGIVHSGQLHALTNNGFSP